MIPSELPQEFKQLEQLHEFMNWTNKEVLLRELFTEKKVARILKTPSWPSWDLQQYWKGVMFPFNTPYDGLVIPLDRQGFELEQIQDSLPTTANTAVTSLALNTLHTIWQAWGENEARWKYALYLAHLRMESHLSDAWWAFSPLDWDSNGLYEILPYRQGEDPYDPHK